jgi:proteasome accessory factor B
MGCTRQTTRQLDVLRTLCAQRPYGLTIAELAGRLDRTVSRRTLERDLQNLAEAGFPLYSERRGRHLYWLLTPDAQLPPLNFTVLEIAALIFAEGMSDALAGTPFREDLRAVCRRLQTTLSPGMQAYFTRAVEVYSPYPRRQKSYAGLQDLIDRLNHAILERRVCQVTYLAMGMDQPKTYPIEPLRLFHYHGGLYLVSRAPAYDQLITQAVERIKDIQATPQTFNPPDDLPIEDRLRHAFGIVYEDPIVSRIRFSVDQAPYIRERLWHPSQRIEELEDGGLILHLYAGGLYELKSWILSQGAAAEVLEPESLRLEIIAELHALLAAYGKRT